MNKWLSQDYFFLMDFLQFFHSSSQKVTNLASITRSTRFMYTWTQICISVSSLCVCTPGTTCATVSTSNKKEQLIQLLNSRKKFNQQLNFYSWNNYEPLNYE
jgi:hypothetical protein